MPACLIEFEGRRYQFSQDATDAEVEAALKQSPPTQPLQILADEGNRQLVELAPVGVGRVLVRSTM